MLVCLNSVRTTSEGPFAKVDSTVPAHQLSAFSRELVDVNSVARMHVKRVRRNNAIVREGFTLLSLSRVLPKPTKSHKVPLWQIYYGATSALRNEFSSRCLAVPIRRRRSP